MIRKNPSPVGGTWACCGVDETGWRVWEDGGFVLADPGGVVTNNQMEFTAALMALEIHDNGWHGVLYSDSRIAASVIADVMENLHTPPGQVIVPRWLDWRLYARMATALRRLGPVEVRHVKGHPSAEDLARGYTLGDNGQRKHDVSTHQVWCDQECGRQATRASLTNGGQERMTKAGAQLRADLRRKLVVE